MTAKEFLESKEIYTETILQGDYSKGIANCKSYNLEQLLNDFLTANRHEYEPGEEVEVSDDGKKWKKVHFIGFRKNAAFGGFRVVIEDDSYRLFSYKHIRKLNPTRNLAIEEIKKIAEKNNIKIEIKE